MDKRILVEVLTASGCSRCQRAKDLAKEVIAEFDNANIQYREINIVEQIDYAVELGVMNTPAIALNGALILSVQPSAKKLRQAIREQLTRD